jgi:hypothetical protein
MKKQVLLTLVTLSFLATSALEAQQVLSFPSVKKNGIYIEPFAPLGAKKELRFGYERMLNRRIAVNAGFGLRLKNEDPGLEEMASEKMAYSFTRTGSSELTWILFVPIWNSSYSAPLPAEKSGQETSRYLQSDYFGTFEFKFFLAGSMRKKVPNGVYLAPGLLGGQRTFVNYTHSSGTRNEIEVYDQISGTWGVPVLLGSHSDQWTERVTVYEYEYRTKEKELKSFLYPYLRAGYQLPIGNFLAVDLSGQILMGEKKIDDQFPEGFEHFIPGFAAQQFKSRLRSSLVLRVSGWF